MEKLASSIDKQAQKLKYRHQFPGSTHNIEKQSSGPKMYDRSRMKSPLEELLEAEEHANLTSNTAQNNQSTVNKIQVSLNDLKLGAQGYSSNSGDDQSISESGITKSGLGADTYAGHLTSHNEYFTGHCGTDRELLSSKRSIKSKAYGMEHGNWMGMDASIQDKTLQDTTVEQSRVYSYSQNSLGPLNFGSSVLQNKVLQISSANRLRENPTPNVASPNVILPFGD